MVYQDGILQLEEQAESGIFLSRILDSKEKGMTWHRLRLTPGRSGKCSWKLRIYCSDSLSMYGEGTEDAAGLLASQTLSLKEKRDRLEPFCVKVIQEKQDVLLHDVQGRFLWFCLEAERREGEKEGLREMRFDFPKRSFLDYLPEAYQRNEKSRFFLERYLGIFQSLYEDMTEQIRQTARFFDPDSTDPEFLSWMAEWIALEDIPAWKEEQLRYLMEHGMELYRIRGTAGYLKKMVQLYSGCESFVVENHQIRKFENNRKQSVRLKEMYGDSVCAFTVLVNTGTLTDQKEYHTLAQVAEHASPAHMECRVVLLQQYIFLDQHSYLGVNSRLSQYRPLQLDGFSAMHFAKIENNNAREETAR